VNFTLILPVISEFLQTAEAAEISDRMMKIYGFVPAAVAMRALRLLKGM